MQHSVLIYEPDNRSELEHYGATLSCAFRDLKIDLAFSQEEAIALASASDVLIAKSGNVSKDIIAAMPKLTWLQSLVSGVDHLRHVGLHSDVLISAARGFHGTQMAELAILQMLALNRGFPTILKNQAKEEWVVWPQPLLFEKTAVIVGVGSIAETVAARCAAFGMHVLGVSGRESVPGFEKLYPRARLKEAAAEADFLIVLIPLDSSTLGLIGKEVFDAMRPSAFLINIARGGVVDEDALIAALESRTISGAAIDVASQEPLPADSELWRAPNLIITPHVGGRADIYHKQVSPLLVSNVRLFLDGRADEIPFQVKL